MAQSISCGVCGREPPFYRRRYEGVALCRRCFKESIERRVRRTISRYKMFSPRDHIGVAVSGGKDSLTLLYILSRIEEEYPEAKITALAVDEGIKRYRDEALKLTESFSDSLDIELRVISFKELYGETMDEIVDSRGLRFPCSCCGVLRRRALTELALRVGVDKIATAHNLDDEAQTVILNMIHGDPLRILSAGPALNGGGSFISKVKPLALIPEKEISLYAYLVGVPFQSRSCPYASTALRNDVREMLNLMEERHPGTLYTIVRSAERLRQAFSKPFPKKILRCKLCGAPSTSEICSVCKIMRGV
ncbi:MAG: TIGR00269 family protein [Candidatus Bathyarchaeia archaeon]|nr:TIGR00269 family protein [Candidatus Bathyarchaeota archaeon]